MEASSLQQSTVSLTNNELELEDASTGGAEPPKRRGCLAAGCPRKDVAGRH
ncbi:hypothetical protein C2845_PM07G22230 [Panicum miliaceum]|uniref:Uncharacterized protein n=1 Tax=Panicum miliaceum TaxID=4540 RepID=A0A3L6SMD5_PANMI|nr:hypothetical protein C2845_PM07G22230 [Panicum miliaceum]